MEVSVGRFPQSKRLAALMLACCVIALTFASCAVPGAATGSTAATGGSILISTPHPADLTPTPAFPPFTIGAWPSNYSPNAGDSITLYVLCRIQDPSMKTPSTPPPAGQGVSVSIGSPVNQSATGSTDNEGLAAIPLTINDTFVGQPVTVNVSTTWNGRTYYASTFFTPSPRALPTPTATPTAPPAPTAPTAPTPAPGATPTSTPTSGSASPTATP